MLGCQGCLCHKGEQLPSNVRSRDLQVVWSVPEKYNFMKIHTCVSSAVKKEISVMSEEETVHKQTLSVICYRKTSHKFRLNNWYFQLSYLEQLRQYQHRQSSVHQDPWVFSSFPRQRPVHNSSTENHCNLLVWCNHQYQVFVIVRYSKSKTGVTHVPVLIRPKMKNLSV